MNLAEYFEYIKCHGHANFRNSIRITSFKEQAKKQILCLGIIQSFLLTDALNVYDNDCIFIKNYYAGRYPLP
jgi:hypothetical protein